MEICFINLVTVFSIMYPLKHLVNNNIEQICGHKMWTVSVMANHRTANEV